MQNSEGVREPGLRERKRDETRLRMEAAAVAIALEKGVENTTVDAISAAADVSPRTFFNYFDSKEDAILGMRDSEIAARAIETHLEDFTGRDIAASVIALFAAVLSPGLSSPELHRSRMKLAKQHPHLFTRQLAQMTRMNEQLTTAIVTLLRENDAYAGRDDDQLATDAEMLLALCGGAFRIAVKEWMVAGGRASTHELETRATALVHDLTERLK
jgi:AcrR family transcriptional regulator